MKNEWNWKMGKSQLTHSTHYIIHFFSSLLLVSHWPTSFRDFILLRIKPSHASGPMMALAASVTSRIALSTGWVWHLKNGMRSGCTTMFLTSSFEREVMKGGSENEVLSQSMRSGYVSALKFIFGTINFLIDDFSIASCSNGSRERSWSNSHQRS